jgi:hypothetical protein
MRRGGRVRARMAIVFGSRCTRGVEALVTGSRGSRRDKQTLSEGSKLVLVSSFSSPSAAKTQSYPGAGVQGLTERCLAPWGLTTCHLAVSLARRRRPSDFLQRCVEVVVSFSVSALAHTRCLTLRDSGSSFK